ncbi:MAG: beta-lactamase family protein [Planctomycetes bacterium]|nr:beta-lactamase family protein [Planctomycetota bacterium]
MLHSPRVLAVLLLCAGLAAQTLPATRPASDLDTRVRAAKGVLDAWRERTGAPGVNAALAWPEGRRIAVASGLAMLEPPRALRPEDRMLAGSVGKIFVSAVTLQLAQEGRLDLDAKLASWFGSEPWFARVPNAPELTLRHLLNHTSGIAEHVQQPEFLAALAKEPERRFTPLELAAWSFDRKPLFAPGKGWSYADTNYIYAGMVLEKVLGRLYHDELQRRLLTPLRLDATTPVEGPELPGLVPGYTAKGGPFPVPGQVAEPGRYAMNPQFEWTGGGLVSTPGDLARFAARLYGGDVLGAKMRAALVAGAVRARTGPNDRYGLGVILWPTRHGEALGHSGWFPGYLTQVAWFADLGVAVAIQVNTDDRKAAGALRRLAEDLVGG